MREIPKGCWKKITGSPTSFDLHPLIVELNAAQQISPLWPSSSSCVLTKAFESCHYSIFIVEWNSIVRISRSTVKRGRYSKYLHELCQQCQILREKDLLVNSRSGRSGGHL